MKSLFAAVLLSVSAAAASELVLWEYDLTELPPFWQNSGFTFSALGANSYMNLYSGGPLADKTTGTDLLTTQYISCPIGYDSLVIHVPQLLELYAGPSTGCNSNARLEVEQNGSWSQLWYRSAYMGGETDSLPIHETVTGISSGDLVRFRFKSYASAFYGYAFVDWWLFGATLTAYGDLALQPETWAGIKLLLSDR